MLAGCRVVSCRIVPCTDSECRDMTAVGSLAMARQSGGASNRPDQVESTVVDRLPPGLKQTPVAEMQGQSKRPAALGRRSGSISSGLGTLLFSNVRHQSLYPAQMTVPHTLDRSHRKIHAEIRGCCCFRRLVTSWRTHWLTCLFPCSRPRATLLQHTPHVSSHQRL